MNTGLTVSAFKVFTIFPIMLLLFPKRVLTEGKTSLTQSAEKRSYTLHFPNFPQKLARPQRDFKLASQPNGQGIFYYSICVLESVVFFLTVPLCIEFINITRIFF